MTNEPCPFDSAQDADELLDYVMWHQPGGPQKREVALANLRSLNEFGLAQLRAEMRGRVREQSRAAEQYDPFSSMFERQ
jgi:hypothetical protein